MTYQEYKNGAQNEFDKLPIFWAFGNKQFKEQMEARDLTENDTDKIYTIGAGGYFLRKDAPIIRAYFEKKDPLKDLMADYDFAYEAFYNELGNHEYHINWEGNYDVIRCFGNINYDENKSGSEYLSDLGYGEETLRAWKNARRDFLKAADENGWY